MVQRIYKHIVLFGFIAVLLVPGLQWAFEFVDVDSNWKLDGHFDVPERPTLTSQSWFDGEFQPQFEKAMQYEIGFRPLFVRTNNQLDYSLYGQINAIDVYEGLDGFWFRKSEDHGIKGEDFVGGAVAREKVDKLKDIQDHFDSLGTHLVVCVAPGKAWYHKEYIPKERLEKMKDNTNYDFYIQQFQEKGIHHIDMNTWFLQMKDTATIPLYSKGGVHWTMYGSFLGADSLISYMEATKNIDIPGHFWDWMLKAEKPWEPETDVYNAANLLSELDEMQMYHPKLQFEDTAGKTRPDVIVIGDSYWHYILWHYIPAKAFSDRSSYWYYFKEKQANTLEQLGSTEGIELEKEYEGQDFVVLLFTPTNLNRFAYGFIDETYEMLHPTIQEIR